jgi:hypothetical protein
VGLASATDVDGHEDGHGPCDAVRAVRDGQIDNVVRFRGLSEPSILDGEQLALPLDALEVVKAAVDETNPRARDQITYGAGHEDLPRLGGRLHPCRKVDGDSPHVTVDGLALTGVNAGPDLEAQTANPVPDRPSALDRQTGGFERDEEPVAGCLHLPALVNLKLAAHEAVVVGEKLSPPLVSEFPRLVRRLDDVRENIPDAQRRRATKTGI